MIFYDLFICSCFFQNQVIEFLWSSIVQYDLDDEQMMFLFQYQRQGKQPRWVKIFSPHVSLGTD